MTVTSPLPTGRQAQEMKIYQLLSSPLTGGLRWAWSWKVSPSPPPSPTRREGDNRLFSRQLSFFIVKKRTPYPFLCFKEVRSICMLVCD
jgi:hypothetical protein